MIKAVVVYEYGGSEALKYEDYPDPTLGEGEVLVQVAATSISPVDTLEHTSMTKAYKPIDFPGVLG